MHAITAGYTMENSCFVVNIRLAGFSSTIMFWSLLSFAGFLDFIFLICPTFADYFFNMFY